MKTLIVFYSRTGTTKKVAEKIAKFLRADIEEVIDLKNRQGIWGYILGGMDAVRKNISNIKNLKYHPEKYDLIIIGTPIWVTFTPAIRTYLERNKQKLNRVAFFSTQGGEPNNKTFDAMANFIGKSPIATLSLRENQVARNNYDSRIKEFVKAIKLNI